jgi:hypothetical protein
MAEPAGKGAGGGAAGAADVEHLATLDLPASINALHFIAVVGVERAARKHPDQAADDRRVGAVQRLGGLHRGARARGGACRKGKAPEDDERRCQ